MKRVALIFAAVLLMGSIGMAQQKSTEHTLKLGKGGRSEPASIEDVAWLAGNWKGEGFGGIVEEAWAPPLGDKQAFFSGLTIHRIDEETLHTYLVMRSSDREVSEELLRFKKY